MATNPTKPSASPEKKSYSAVQCHKSDIGDLLLATKTEPPIKKSPRKPIDHRASSYRLVAQDLSNIAAKLEPNILKLFPGGACEQKSTDAVPTIVPCSLSQVRSPVTTTKNLASTPKLSSPPRYFDNITSMSLTASAYSGSSKQTHVQALLESTNITLQSSPEILMHIGSQLQQPLQAKNCAPSSSSHEIDTRQVTLKKLSDSIESHITFKYYVMGPFTLPKLVFIWQGMTAAEYAKQSKHFIDLLCMSHVRFQRTKSIYYTTSSCYTLETLHSEFPKQSKIIFDSIRRILAFNVLKDKYAKYFCLPDLLLCVLSDNMFKEDQLIEINPSFCKPDFKDLATEKQRRLCTDLRLDIGLLTNHVNNNCIIPKFCEENIALDCMIDIIDGTQKDRKATEYFNILVNSFKRQSFERSLSTKDDFAQLQKNSYTNDLLIDIILMHFSIMFDTFYGTQTFCVSPFLFLETQNCIATTFYNIIDTRTKAALKSTNKTKIANRLDTIDLIVFPICCKNHWSAYIYIGKDSRLGNCLMSLCKHSINQSSVTDQTPVWLHTILQCNSLENYHTDASYSEQVIRHMNTLYTQLSSTYNSSLATETLNYKHFTDNSIVPIRVCQQRDQYNCAYHVFLLVFSLLSMVQKGYNLPREVSPEQLCSGNWAGLYKPASAYAMKYWVLQYLINNSIYTEASSNNSKSVAFSKRASLRYNLDSLSSSSSVHILSSD